MDSMKSLNTSLPRASRPSHPPEQLLQAFKNAALSVTNLYRTAEASEHRSRQAGYQDALDELLAFLDQQNIGLEDGEGWLIRRWATERLDAQPTYHGGSESDEDRQEAGKPTQSDNTQKKDDRRPRTNSIQREPPSSSPTPDGPPMVENVQVTHEDTIVPTREKFTFRSSYQYPQDVAAQQHSSTGVDIQSSDIHESLQPKPSITVNVLPRSTRSSRGSRQVQRGPAARGLGIGAGTKRRVPYGEYFDLAGLEGGGGKKGRSE